jgi:quercetin dioxygenase-like cupin family protein
VGVVHRFIGQKGAFEWEGKAPEEYIAETAKGASINWLIGPREGAPHFAIRYIEVEPGGQTSLDDHEHEHGVMILRGKGEVLMGQEEVEVGFGDILFVPGNERHQFRNAGDEPFGFLCVIPRI